MAGKGKGGKGKGNGRVRAEAEGNEDGERKGGNRETSGMTKYRVDRILPARARVDRLITASTVAQ